MPEIWYAKNIAPRYVVEVEQFPLNYGVTQFIERVEYESCDGIADLLRLEVMNPDFEVSKRKLFLPGNELSLWFGYDNELEHVGRAVITNIREMFPLDGMPTMQVDAYTKDHLMAEVRPDPEMPEKVKKRGRGSRQKEEKVAWGKQKISDVVSQIALKHDLEPDVDPTEPTKRPLNQPMKMSDYDFIKGLSNLTGYAFWVDGDKDGTWHLHFKDPHALGTTKQYVFKYFQGDETSLLNFEPEMVYKGHYTKIQAQATLPSGKVIKVSFVEDEEQTWSTKPTDQDDFIEDPFAAASAIQIYIGDYAFSAVHKGEIKDRATLEWWVDNWFKKHKRDFIVGKGEVPGLPSLRARQTHFLDGLGTMYNGPWDFTRVRHTLDANAGYLCEFNARKI